MSDKSCNTCGWNDGFSPVCNNPERSYRIEENYSCWKPKEEKTVEKIQMTEEQADKFYDDNDLDQIIKRNHFIDKLKDTGYIKKSDLEIARDRLNHLSYIYDNNKNNDEWAGAMENLCNEQQKEINRLNEIIKGENNDS